MRRKIRLTPPTNRGIERRPVRRSATFSIVALLFALSIPAFADSFTFTANSVQSSNAKGRERTILSGNARMVTDTTTITADHVEIYGTDFQYADCTGNVTVRDEKKGIFLTTSTLFYDRKKKLSRTQGPTTMEDKKNKVVIKGSMLENDDESETTIVQVGVRMLKENMAARSEYALYHRKDKLLELSGTPVVYRDGDKYSAQRIVVNTDTDEITLEGDVSGSVVQKEAAKTDKDNRATSSGPSPDPAKANPEVDAAPEQGLNAQAGEEKK